MPINGATTVLGLSGLAAGAYALHKHLEDNKRERMLREADREQERNLDKRAAFQAECEVQRQATKHAKQRSSNDDQQFIMDVDFEHALRMHELIESFYTLIRHAHEDDILKSVGNSRAIQLMLALFWPSSAKRVLQQIAALDAAEALAFTSTQVSKRDAYIIHKFLNHMRFNLAEEHIISAIPNVPFKHPLLGVSTAARAIWRLCSLVDNDEAGVHVINWETTDDDPWTKVDRTCLVKLLYNLPGTSIMMWHDEENFINRTSRFLLSTEMHPAQVMMQHAIDKAGLRVKKEARKFFNLDEYMQNGVLYYRNILEKAHIEAMQAKAAACVKHEMETRFLNNDTWKTEMMREYGKDGFKVSFNLHNKKLAPVLPPEHNWHTFKGIVVSYQTEIFEGKRKNVNLFKTGLTLHKSNNGLVLSVSPHPITSPHPSSSRNQVLKSWGYSPDTKKFSSMEKKFTSKVKSSFVMGHRRAFEEMFISLRQIREAKFMLHALGLRETPEELSLQENRSKLEGACLDHFVALTMAGDPTTPWGRLNNARMADIDQLQPGEAMRLNLFEDMTTKLKSSIPMATESPTLQDEEQHEAEIQAFVHDWLDLQQWRLVSMPCNKAQQYPEAMIQNTTMQAYVFKQIFTFDILDVSSRGKVIFQVERKKRAEDKIALTRDRAIVPTWWIGILLLLIMSVIALFWFVLDEFFQVFLMTKLKNMSLLADNLPLSGVLYVVMFGMLVWTVHGLCHLIPQQFDYDDVKDTAGYKKLAHAMCVDSYETTAQYLGLQSFEQAGMDTLESRIHARWSTWSLRILHARMKEHTTDGATKIKLDEARMLLEDWMLINNEDSAMLDDKFLDLELEVDEKKKTKKKESVTRPSAVLGQAMKHSLNASLPTTTPLSITESKDSVLATSPTFVQEVFQEVFQQHRVTVGEMDMKLNSRTSKAAMDDSKFTTCRTVRDVATKYGIKLEKRNKHDETLYKVYETPIGDVD